MIGYVLCTCSEEYLVLVKAQVMTRDDSKGGWFPLEKGGMSRVGLRKLVLHAAPLNSNAAPCGSAPSPQAPPSDIKHEYHIHGTQIVDQTVSISFPLRI